jgi:hypothetical protein
VRPTIAGFLSGALGLSKAAILNTEWVFGGVPSGYGAITIGSTVNFDEDDLSNNDIAFWVETVGHESTHRDDIENQGFFSFYWEYLRQYFSGRDTKEPHNEAYENIDAEKKAYGNQKQIDQFFSDPQNYDDFMGVLNNKSLSDSKKSDLLEALGIERVAIPSLNNLAVGLTNKLQSLDQKTDSALIKAINDLLSYINTAISNDQKNIKKLRS